MKALTRSLFAPLALLMLSSFVPAASAADIQGKEMTLPATEHPVKVEFFRAPGNAKRPTVLMLHGGQGWGGAEGRTENFRQYGSELANHGFDAYMVYYYSDQDIADRKANAPGVSQRRFPAWAKLVSDLTTEAKRFPPLLIMHGEADTREPIERGKALLAAAKKVGADAEFVSYPNTNHGFGQTFCTPSADDAF